MTSPLETADGMQAKAEITSGPKGEFKIDVEAHTHFKYDYTFLDDDSDRGVFDLERTYLADRFRSYGRCVVVMDARVYDIYGAEMHAYFEHFGLGCEVFPLGIDEQQKSMRTIEEVMVFFANVGLMRREKPLISGGGLITDIVGTACSLYRRSTAYIRLPTTLIGMIDASIAIKVGGNLAEKHKNRIGAFHPHDGVIIDFHLLKSLPEAHIRNGISELTKISCVEESDCFNLIEAHCQDLIKYRFGFGEGAPAGLREIARTIARKAVHRMLTLECPNLLEHDQRRAIAYGHTWSPVYELTPKPHPLHHGHAIAIDMCFSATWAAKEGWISEELRDRVHGIFRKIGLSLYHPSFTVAKLHYGTSTILQRRDGDLYAAIPDTVIGKCRYIMLDDFKDRDALDASLEEALLAHVKLVEEKYEGGQGVECYITEGFDKKGTGCSTCKLEMGTWSERIGEMLDGVAASQSYEAVVDRVTQIKRWWDLTQSFAEANSTRLGDGVVKLLADGKASQEAAEAPLGLDMQSAQTLDFFAALRSSEGSVAWDLGTLPGVSSAVLAQHMEVVAVERDGRFAGLARRNLPSEVRVVQADALPFLQERAEAGEKAELIFMDLDRSSYLPCYELIMERGLLKPGGLLLCMGLLCGGLAAQRQAGEALESSESNVQAAEAVDTFLQRTRADAEAGKVRTLMMPIHDGMFALSTR